MPTLDNETGYILLSYTENGPQSSSVGGFGVARSRSLLINFEENLPTSSPKYCLSSVRFSIVLEFRLSHS